MGFSAYGKKSLLECFLQHGPKLFLAAFYKSKGSDFVELSGNGYIRVPLKGCLAIDEDGAISNPEDILFPLARDDWGKVSAIGVVDEDGVEIVVNEITKKPEITLGQRLRVPANQVKIALVDQK